MYLQSPEMGGHALRGSYALYLTQELSGQWEKGWKHWNVEGEEGVTSTSNWLGGDPGHQQRLFQKVRLGEECKGLKMSPCYLPNKSHSFPSRYFRVPPVGWVPLHSLQVQVQQGTHQSRTLQRTKGNFSKKWRKSNSCNQRPNTSLTGSSIS